MDRSFKKAHTMIQGRALNSEQTYSMYNNVSKFLEFAPCEVAFNLDIAQQDLPDRRTLHETAFDRIEASFSHRVAAQVDSLHTL